MVFLNGLKQGDELNNSQLTNVFKCAPQGGMRRSHRTNSLVIISDPYKSLYMDRWISDTFYYTGMGQVGDQNLHKDQNKTLNESNKNGVEVYLFEVFEPKKYTFIGRVQLIADPFTEKQLDKYNNARVVWVFSLKLKDGFKKLEIDIQKNENRKEKQVREAGKLSTEELRRRAELSHGKPGTRSVRSTTFERDQYIVEYAKRWANGVCQLCEEKAPFNDKKGKPYFHTHHIKWLSKGGSDTIDNAVALCPNCHDKMHILNKKSDIKKLIGKVQEHINQLK
ncbi:HNH endonuclease [Sporosarcina sp. NPDC096371]|uniref:HNH endonuclease n=1 Tax=Sporosarcina sp. NPDC096371 TaxID=3364530 RepID=UPI0037F96B15